MLLNYNNARYISYIGYTNNLKKRLISHNTSKGAKFTRGRIWKMIYSKKFNTKSEALKFEYFLKKNYSLRKSIKEKYIKKFHK